MAYPCLNKYYCWHVQSHLGEPYDSTPQKTEKKKRQQKKKTAPHPTPITWGRFCIALGYSDIAQKRSLMLRDKELYISWFNKKHVEAISECDFLYLYDQFPWCFAHWPNGSLVWRYSLRYSQVCSGSIVVTTLDCGPGGSWLESRVGTNILWGSIDCTGITRAFIPLG